MNKDEPIEDIIRQLRDRFGSFPSKSDFEEQLTSFTRQQNEPIKSCMNRYQYIIKNLYKNDPNINNIIERSCSEKVKKVAHPDARIHLERAEKQHCSKLDYKSRLQIIHREEELLRQNGTPVPPKINQLYASDEYFESEDEDSESDSDQDEFIHDIPDIPDIPDNPDIHTLHDGHPQGQEHNQASYEDVILHPPQHYEEDVQVDALENHKAHQRHFHFQQPNLEHRQHYHHHDSNQFMNNVQPSQIGYDQFGQLHNQNYLEPQDEFEPSNELDQDEIEPDVIEPCNELEPHDQMDHVENEQKQDEIEPIQDENFDQSEQQFYCNTVTTPEQEYEETPPHEVGQPKDKEPECHTSSPMDVGTLYEIVGKFVNKICPNQDNNLKICVIVDLLVADAKNTSETTK